MSMHIVDNEQRGDCPQDHVAGPSAQFPAGLGATHGTFSTGCQDARHLSRSIDFDKNGYSPNLDFYVRIGYVLPAFHGKVEIFKSA